MSFCSNDYMFFFFKAFLFHVILKYTSGDLIITIIIIVYYFHCNIAKFSVS